MVQFFLLTVSNIFSGSSQGEHSLGLRLLGMFLVFISQGIQAFQTVVGRFLASPMTARGAFASRSRGTFHSGCGNGRILGIPFDCICGFAYCLYSSRRGRKWPPWRLHWQSDSVVGKWVVGMIGSKNSKTILWLNIASVIVLLLFNLSSMRVTLVRFCVWSDG